MQTMLGVREIAALGEKIYEDRIKARENELRGQFALIDVESGDYEIDADEEAAAQRLRTRHPDSVFYVKKIGYAASESVGGAR